MGPSTGSLPMTLLIETLGPGGTPTVVARQGRPRPWAALPRMADNRLLAEKVRAVVAGVAESARPITLVLPPRRGRRVRVLGHPVLGPSGVVHAVQIWAGDLDAEPAPPRRVAAFTWSAASRLIELGLELNEPYVDAALAGHRTLTAPEAFRCIAQLDDAMTLVAKALEPAPEDRWDGSATLRTAQGPRTAHLAMRSMPAPQQQFWRGLIHDVSDAVPAGQPTLDAAALAALAAREPPTAIAIMDVAQARLLSWITDPLPGIQWKGIVDNRDTPHPDDVVRIFQNFKRLRDGAATQVEIPAVRLRRLAGGWTVVDARVTVIPKTAGPLVVLAELTPVAGTASSE